MEPVKTDIMNDEAAKSSEVVSKYFVKPDGSFVGDFESMYREYDDPWLQNHTAVNSPLKSLVVRQMADLDRPKALDIGCGNGAFSNRVYTEAHAEVLGLDVSQSAVHQARTKFPGVRFETAHATEIARYKEFQPSVVLMLELTWCILDSFITVLETLKTHFGGAILYHTLTFYAPGKQKYGTEYFTCLDELLPYFAHMKVQETFVRRRYSDDGSVNTLLIAQI